MIITIDGPAGTGKTTVARKVADRLGYLYFDTGAMYRALTYKLLSEQVSLRDPTALSLFLSAFQFEIRQVAGEKRYFTGEEDVTESIRNKEVTQGVSEVSAVPLVRQTLVSFQRRFGEGGDAVFEGRDMGTVVFPNAEIKVFLTARPAVRAERRYLEIKDKLKGTTQEEIMQELLKRDHFDSTREASPLKQATDAVLIDTSDLTIDQVVDQVVALISRKRV